MKVKDAEILIVPGLNGAGPDHWQSRWQAKLSTARRVEQADWDAPTPDAWVSALVEAVDTAERPVVLIAHSLGVAAVVKAAPLFAGDVRGAFLVAPPDLERENLSPPLLADFAPYPRDPLPFPSVTVASTNDPYCEAAVAEDIAAAWGSLFIDAGASGHINTDAGFGPWPEGSMAFAKFLSGLPG